MENLAFSLIIVVGVIAGFFNIVNEKNNRNVKEKNRVRKA
jgi:hypothetical protein